MHILPGRVRMRFRELKNNPSLAEELQVILKKANGILDVQAIPLTGSCLVFFDQHIPVEQVIETTKQCLKNVAIHPRKYTLNKRKGFEPEDQPLKTQFRQVITGGAILTLFWGLPPLGATIPAAVPLPVSSAALITTGYPIFKSGLSYFSKHKRPNYDFLISALSIGSTLMGKGYLGIMTMWLSTLSSYLQKLSFKAASRSFSNTLIKKGNKISLLKEGRIHPVLPGDVTPGDLAVFEAGECVPVEGEVVSGHASVIPGENLLPGKHLEAGTVISRGHLVVQVHRVVEDTSLARLADILDDAIEQPDVGGKLALAYAEKLLPVTLLTTVLVFTVTKDLQRTVSVLLAGAPGPAGLAAPTAISAATGLAAGMGMAVKDGDALELLSHVDVVIFNDKSLTQSTGSLHPALQKLEEEGYKIEDFDPQHIHTQDEMQLGEKNSHSPYHLVEKMHQKGLKVAWVSGPEHPSLVENADVNIMFLTGKEKSLEKAQILCYKNDPKQVYKMIDLSRKTLHTIKENVFFVQGMTLLGQALSALGIISSVPAVGLTLLTTLAVVLNSGHTLIGIGSNKFTKYNSSGTIQGLSVDKGKCLLLTKEK